MRLSSNSRRRLAQLAVAIAVAGVSASAHGGEARKTTPKRATTGAKSAAVVIDRVVARWTSPATGGARHPQFVFARELAFEARIEAMADGGEPSEPISDAYVRGAMQRSITETMLARLPVDPEPTPKQVAAYAESARLIIEQRVGGRPRLRTAATQEGISADELDALLRRQARASWYLDRMIAPMLEPTEPDLREVHRSGETPYTDQPFDQIAPQLRRWLVATRLTDALAAYFRNARARLDLKIVRPAGKRRDQRRRR